MRWSVILGTITKISIAFKILTNILGNNESCAVILPSKPVFAVKMLCMAEKNINHKKVEIIQKYRALVFQLNMTYREYRIVFVPLIIRVLGGISPKLPKNVSNENIRSTNNSRNTRSWDHWGSWGLTKPTILYFRAGILQRHLLVTGHRRGDSVFASCGVFRPLQRTPKQEEKNVIAGRIISDMYQL